MKKPASPSSIQVIDRLAHLLDAIATHEGVATLKVLAAETGLHPSTAFRILAAAAAQEFVCRDESGTYRLGIKLLQLGQRVQAGIDLNREALPIMEWLRDQVGETVNLAVREGDEMVYVERVITRRMMRVEQVVGSRAPLHVTAVGKMILAHEGEEACYAYARRTGLPAFTVNTLSDLLALQAELQQSLQQGYALDNEEAELGVGCIGVLVRDSNGTIVAGLSVSAPIERRQDAWIPLVIQAGRKLSQRLGYSEEIKATSERVPNESG